jgi:hypothetical protein
MLAAGSRYSAHTADERRDIEAACRAVTSTFYDDLDLSAEIRTVAARNLGNTLLLWESASRLAPLGKGERSWWPAALRQIRCRPTGSRCR